MSKRTEHVVMHDGTHRPAGTLECLHCGTTEAVALPIPVPDLLRRMQAFARQHADCPKPAPVGGAS